MSRFTPTAVMFMFLSIMVIARGAYLEDNQTQKATMVGTVTDTAGLPILQASVSAFYGPKRLTQPQPVQPNGAFEVALPQKLSHITCKIEAPGYLSQTLTIPSRGSKLDFGIIALEKRKLLALSRLSLNITNSGDNQIDALVENKTTARVLVSEIRLSGARKRLTNCLDLTPAITLKIAKDDNKLNVNISDENGKHVETVRLSGDVRIKPCDQLEFAYTLRRLLGFSAGERALIRFVAPREISQAKRELVLDIENWDSLGLRLILDDGTFIDTE